MGSWFTNLAANISAFKDSVGSWFVNLGTSIGDGLTSVKDKITGALGEQLSNIKQGFDNVKNNFVDLLKKLAELWLEVNTLPLRIQDKVKELFEYFFVPDEDLMNQRLDAVREKFAFIDSIAGYGEHLLNFLQSASGTKAPVIKVNLRAYKGSYGWASGGEVSIDFAWYAQYKSAVDNLLAGIIWAHWLWNVYKRIPEIIHGQGMVADRAIDISRRDI